MRRQLGSQMESVKTMLDETGLELRISGNRRNQDETVLFLYDVENVFVVGANDLTLDRDRLHHDRLKYTFNHNEEF